ncbi:MAG: hypothetical protein ACRECT_00145 [Thermoplasmata archaeon]
MILDVMFLENCPNRGHDYWIVARAVREGVRVHNETALYLGRLDNLTAERRAELELKVAALHDEKILYAFYLQLAKLGLPTPGPSRPDFLEEGPFSLPPVDFATLTEALRQDDLTSRELAALVSRIGLPLRPEELVAAGIRVEVGKKTVRSISLYYRATSNRRPRIARPATDPSRPRRPSDAGSKRSGRS